MHFWPGLMLVSRDRRARPRVYMSISPGRICNPLHNRFATAMHKGADGHSTMGALRMRGFQMTMVLDPQRELREEYKHALRKHARVRAELQAQGMSHFEAFEAAPQIDWHRFSGLRCGARTKTNGEPCKLTSIYPNGRCKYHGGCSTGPRTAEGKAISAKNGLLAPQCDHIGIRRQRTDGA